MKEREKWSRLLWWWWRRGSWEREREYVYELELIGWREENEDMMIIPNDEMMIIIIAIIWQSAIISHG